MYLHNTLLTGRNTTMDFKNLTDEQKAKIAGKTPEELLALAKEEGVPLSEDDLDGIAGGWDILTCPNCGAEVYKGNSRHSFKCKNCGTEFTE